MTSVAVILGLLVCIEAPGSSAVTPVFVQKGKDLLLEVMEPDVPENFSLLSWRFNGKDVLVRFLPSKEPIVSNVVYTGRVEASVKNFSVKLKNLQEADSGVYTARVIGTEEEQKLAGYNVTVQDPVSPVAMTVDSVSSSSDSCSLTVTCSTQDSQHINSTFTCDTNTCSQEGGERSKVTSSGASLNVYLLNDLIICNHSNHVSWTNDSKMIDDFCWRYTGSEAGISLCLAKTVVFSVGLVIMVSAVISVHLMEKLKRHK
ncbi:CD48 antigen-like [Seriola lalandi dorsalis]|uniref:CD48 antigen-like n=1 Tax=Seriola lalandi dorsalis TaxID=1841481 RepID=UPI000C6F8395|nr:CD48 antigen-like [Seriola lalandi dorsalis]